MKQLEIKGIIPPVVTPMNPEDESVNIPELRNQIERQITAGVHGIFPFGTNGEAYILDMKEKEEILEATVDQVKGRIPVYAGTGCISTRDTVYLQAGRGPGSGCAVHHYPQLCRRQPEGALRPLL